MKIDKQTYEDICFGDIDEKYEIVEGGDWVDEGKYSYKDVVFKFNGKCYNVSYSRSGSYHTDYDYDWEYDNGPFDCIEVEKQEVVVSKWVAVKSLNKSAPLSGSPVPKKKAVNE